MIKLKNKSNENTSVNNRQKVRPMLDIYSNRETIKWVIMGVALLIGIFSLIYTDQLADALQDRELMEIELFANGIKVIASPDSTDYISFILKEILNKNYSVPMILTDEEGIPQEYRNLSISKKLTEEEKKNLLLKEVQLMKKEYKPIEIRLDKNWKQYVYYKHSSLITQLQYYPFVQLAGIAVFATLSYLIFSSTRTAEQNRVWVGLAKETAHQLGTPISSLIAWIEYFKSDPSFDKEIIMEMNKDIKKLEMITARFSNIGFAAPSSIEKVDNVVKNVVSYLEKRISPKIKIKIIPKFGEDLLANLNVPLFEWVIENLCKNAVDAIEGSGKIEIYIKSSKDQKKVMIDVHDTGKGIPISKLKSIFRPGFTTKARGWGLGLTLVKRIIEKYHRGKIFVHKSEQGSGTRFRILLPKA